MKCDIYLSNLTQVANLSSSGVLLCSLRDAGWFCSYDAVNNVEKMTDAYRGNIFEVMIQYEPKRAEKVREVRISAFCN